MGLGPREVALAHFGTADEHEEVIVGVCCAARCGEDGLAVAVGWPGDFLIAPGSAGV